jgi:methyl-accepting chemotaxis protein
MFGMIDRWIGNIRISRKLLIASSVAIVLPSLMAPVALRSLSEQSQLIERVTTVDAEKSATVAALVRAIPEASSFTNRIIALASNSTDEQAIKRLTAEMDKRFADATSLIGKLAASDLADHERQVVTEIGKDLKAYADSSRKVAVMAPGDGATAYMISGNGEKFYADLSAKLNDLLAIERAEAVSAHESSMHDAQTTRLAFIALALVAIIVAVFINVMIARAIAGSIARLSASTIRLAEGDASVTIDGADRKDEIGAMAGALGTFKQNAIEKARIEEEQRARHAQAAARQQSIEAAIAAFEGQVGKALEALGAASGEMRLTAETLSTTAETSNHQVKTVASAAEEASSNVQTVAAASEELSTSISEIGQQVARAARITDRAVDEARQTDSTVQGLSAAAQKIGEVVKLINDIASQTNLLALNATIEAARAGEAGKGFAVVASEVKSLATQTAKATEDISTQIAAVQSVTEDTVSAIKRIGGTIGEVSSVATSIASAVEQQGAATKEISRNTQQAAQGTRQVSSNIVGVAEGATATGTTAQAVKSAAESLSEQAERLRGQVDNFLAKIRAA